MPSKLNYFYNYNDDNGYGTRSSRRLTNNIDFIKEFKKTEKERQKNKEYKTITADDNAIAAITFFESIIF